MLEVCRELFRLFCVISVIVTILIEMTYEEQQEFKSLLLPHVDELHRMAYHLCHTHCDAEDLVMEAVAKACEHFHRLRDKTKAKPWLFRILSNTFISACRSKRGHPTVEYLETPDDDHFSLFDKVSQPFLLWWGNPERELINKLMDEDIHRALDELPNEFRLAVVLCDVEGCSYKEIAGILQVPIGTVRSRIMRGRSLLQKKLYHHARDLGLIHSGNHHHETTRTFPQEHRL